MAGLALRLYTGARADFEITNLLKSHGVATPWLLERLPVALIFVIFP